MSQPDRPSLELPADEAETARGVVVPQKPFERYLITIATLLDVVRHTDDPSEQTLALIGELTEQTKTLQGRTVRLLPQHLYDLATRAPGVAAPYELWAPLVEAGLRLTEERDAAVNLAHVLEEERDRARETAVRLEQELAHVDELISRALFDVGRGDVDADEAARELVARIRVGAAP